MARILHILKEQNSAEAEEIIGLQNVRHPGELSVLLIQEGVRTKPRLKMKTFVLQEDARSRGIVPGENSISYAQMIEMILGHDAVVVW